MAIWRAVANDQYSVSANVLTLNNAPQEDDRFTLFYSYADVTDPAGHIHTRETRQGGWNGGRTWALGHTPDSGELLLLQQASGLVYVVESDFQATTSMKLRLYEVDYSAPTALSWTQVDGPWDLPAGEELYCMASPSARYCLLGMKGGGAAHLYLFDRQACTFTAVDTHTGMSSDPWRIRAHSDTEWVMLYTHQSDYLLQYTTDAGAHWHDLGTGMYTAGAKESGVADLPICPYDVDGTSGGTWSTVQTGWNNNSTPRTYWMVAKSVDDGATWAPLVGTFGQFSRGDRSWLYVRPDGLGKHIGRSFNNYGAGNLTSGFSGMTTSNDASGLHAV